MSARPWSGGFVTNDPAPTIAAAIRRASADQTG
jgi:hypothetical protein